MAITWNLFDILREHDVWPTTPYSISSKTGWIWVENWLFYYKFWRSSNYDERITVESASPDPDNKVRVLHQHLQWSHCRLSVVIVDLTIFLDYKPQEDVIMHPFSSLFPWPYNLVLSRTPHSSLHSKGLVSERQISWPPTSITQLASCHSLFHDTPSSSRYFRFCQFYLTVLVSQDTYQSQLFCLSLHKPCWCSNSHCSSCSPTALWSLPCWLLEQR